ncbi:MAG TPA: metallophosphoesterase [Actinomycetota bacterium]
MRARRVLSSAQPLGRIARTLAPWLLPLLAGAIGALLAVTFLVHEDARIGPVTVRLSARPALSGSSRLALPPFGSVSARTHLGPIAFHATLDDVDVPELGRMIDNAPASGGLADALAPLERQADRAAAVFLLKLALLGLAGSLLGVIAFRRRSWRVLRRCLLGGAIALQALLIPTVATFDVTAFRAPRYQGTVEYAPTLIGDVRTGVQRLHTLRDEMALISENLNRAYDALAQPPPDLAGGGTVRVLHVSDLHLNPTGFDLAQRLAAYFEVDGVVDTGDMGTWGLPIEPAIAAKVRGFQANGKQLPYLFVKGNHDSPDMVRAVAHNPNARVLNWSATTIRGISFYGVGDPSFSPGEGYRTDEFELLKRSKSIEVGEAIDARVPRPDVLLVHDPQLATYAAGHVATVLDGHLHAFGLQLVNGTRMVTDGTTGAAGPDGFRNKNPQPYSAEVLYFDTHSRRPLAVDRITVDSLRTDALQSTFSVQRILLPEGETPFVANPVQIPPELLQSPENALRQPPRQAPAVTVTTRQP